MWRLGDLVSAKKVRTGGGVCKVLCQKSMCGRWRGAWACAGWRVDLSNGKIMLQKLFNPEWQITSKFVLPSSSLIRLFFFTNRRNFQVRTWVWRKFAVENHVDFQRGDWTGVKWSSQSKKKNFLTLPDLAFGFVHKRSGNEIKEQHLTSERSELMRHCSYHGNIKFISSGYRVMFFLLYKHTDDGVFDDFPKISDHFPNISEDFPKLFWRPDEHSRTFAENFRRCPKISKDCQRLSRKTQRCFDNTPANLSTI